MSSLFTIKRACLFPLLSKLTFNFLAMPSTASHSTFLERGKACLDCRSVPLLSPPHPSSFSLADDAKWCVNISHLDDKALFYRDATVDAHVVAVSQPDTATTANTSMNMARRVVKSWNEISRDWKPVYASWNHPAPLPPPSTRIRRRSPVTS